jgi:hypothetical protein
VATCPCRAVLRPHFQTRQRQARSWTGQPLIARQTNPAILAPYSVTSLAFASLVVCHCMLLGSSMPPRFSGWIWSIT